MHIKFITLLLAVSLITISPSSTLASQTSQTEDEVLRGSLTAILSYIRHAFDLEPKTPLSENELRTTIHDGVSWLVNSQEENGHFAYEYLPYQDHYRPDDNIVRQAGALFALGEYARKNTALNTDVNEAIENSIAWFETLSPEDTEDGKTFRCIIDGEGSVQCKLGATSLALAGILGYVERYPDKAPEYKDLIESYTAFILAMKKASTGFKNLHYVNSDTESDKESSFSNGEALMTLVKYYQYNPSKSLKDLIDESFTYMKNSVEFDSALYLWIMAALKDMQTLWPSDAYISYTRDYTDWRLQSVALHKKTDHNYCAYIEGIVSAYSILESSSTKEELTELRDEIDFWLAKTDRLQLEADDVYRVRNIDGALSMEIQPNPEQAHGGFLTGYDELAQRIDFTQHCVSAYMQTLVDIDGKNL